jgi:hypothetical protein
MFQGFDKAMNPKRARYTRNSILSKDVQNLFIK